MKALNADILLEYLVEENEDCGKADLFFKTGSESDIYFINNIVLHEIVTHFEENIKFDKSDILKVLKALVSNSQIMFENREIILESIEIYMVTKDSFSKCLKSVINTGFKMNDLTKQKENRGVNRA